MTRRRELLLSALIVAAVFVCTALALPSPSGAAARGGGACPDSLPLPSAVGEQAYEPILNRFLEGRCYRGWVHDREIRNTGPFIDGRNFGTHPAVRVYYSPRAWQWMTERHRQGRMADNAVIVKEMYPPPAGSDSALSGWTTMVRDSAGSFDGWYWGYYGPADPPQRPIDYPSSGFGLYCTRCHASAERELTFAAVRNVDPAEDPLSFVVQTLTTVAQGSPRHAAMDALSVHGQVELANESSRHELPKPLPAPDPAILALYGLSQHYAAPNAKTALPVETYDHVVAGPGGPEQFLTSDQCTGCHSASTFNMAFLTAGGRDTFNLSPYGEWRASLMGLAGRDPVFHAQRESEVTRFPMHRTLVDTTCYRCHGVMGQRQARIDGTMFRHDMVYATPGQPGAKYGALARDGISCMACHQISAIPTGGDTATFTGRFRVDPPGHVNGPYDPVVELAMLTALGIKPRPAPQIRTAALCGSCHTVVLPVFDRQGRQLKTDYEQATYPEWLNSVYQNEVTPFDADSARTCQGCHMPQDFRGNRLRYRAAIIEDPTYPMADHRARDSAITVAVRDTFSRHMLMGANLFTLAMFQQFPDTLGIRSTDYMYSAGVQPLVNAGLSALTLAREQAARVRVEGVRGVRDSLEVAVRVENLAGHRLPSGVGFRRAFLELAVTGGREVLWASGRTNSLGVILRGTTDQPLPTEFFTRPVSAGGVFQPHHETITREDQVQIYEELVRDPEGMLTTSFLALDSVVKENRLQPRGWRRGGPFWHETQPHGESARDGDYWNGGGADRLVYRIPLARVRGATAVRATLFYQATPPYYLAQRFGIRCGSLFPTDCSETRRLAYLVSRLRTVGTPIENWKLMLATGEHRIPAGTN
jgi:hypothetical protein